MTVGKFFTLHFSERPWEEWASSLSDFVDMLGAKTTLTNPAVYGPLLFLLGALTLMSLFLRKRLSMKSFSVLAFFLVMADCWSWGLKFFSTTLDHDTFIKADRLMETLKEDGNYARFSMPAFLYPPNKGVLFKVFSVSGYEPLILRRYAELVNLAHKKPIDIVPAALFEDDYFSTHTFMNSKLADLMNVKFFMMPGGKKIEGMSPIFKGRLFESLDPHYSGEISVYTNPSSLPRAMLIHKAVVVKNDHEIIKRLTDESFDPEDTIILSEEPPIPLLNSPSPEDEVEIVHYRPNSITLQTNSTSKGFLFLSEVFYPGWQAYVDGWESQILRADYLFRAVPLDEGSHEVLLVYRPQSLFWGGIASILAFGFGAPALTYLAIKRRK